MPSPQTIRAREPRRTQTPTELALWKLLRAHQMRGFGFRRQHPIDRFFANFACPTAKLIIELDGVSHDHRLEQDGVRDAHLRANGWTTLRFQNRDLQRHPEGIWVKIERFLLASSAE